MAKILKESKICSTVQTCGETVWKGRGGKISAVVPKVWNYACMQCMHWSGKKGNYQLILKSWKFEKKVNLSCYFKATIITLSKTQNKNLDEAP